MNDSTIETTNAAVVFPGGEVRKSSREIAELTGKRHDYVLRDIKSLISQEAITAPNFGVSECKDSTGRTLPQYLLDFDATMTLITGYDAKRRAMIIKRWRELETGEAEPAYKLPQSYSEALASLLETVKQKEELETPHPNRPSRYSL